MYELWDGSVWCDIVIKLMPAYYAGVSGAATATCKKLAIVLGADPSTVNRTVWRSQLIMEYMLGLVCPLWMVVVHIFIQPSRYVITPGYGCFATVDPDWVAIFLYEIVPPVMSVYGAYYTGKSTIFPFQLKLILY